MGWSGHQLRSRKRAQDATLLLVINSFSEVVDFKLPESPGGKGWTRLADTNAPDDEPPTPFAFGDTYQVTGRSLLLFLLEPDGAYTTARMSTDGPHSARDTA